MKNILLVHLGRSGSTVLGNLVDQYPSMNWMGEVFTLAEQKGEIFKSENDLNNFFGELQPNDLSSFGAEVKLINILGAVSENEDTSNAVKKYLQFVHRLSKSYSLTPVLLLRNNVLKRLVSCHSAAKTGVWHVQNGEKNPQKSTLNFPVNELKDWDTGFTGSLNEVLHNGAWVNSLLENYFRAHNWETLYYEKDIEKDPVYSANKLIDLAVEREEKVDVAFQVKFGRTNPTSLEEKLANYEEISNSIDSDFRWMLAE
ncbi:hypothetical protein [Pseudoalteromonas sp. NCIMB_1079]|uniref:hypothetical protein n=1 Tax=Pseudoalteromonas sp. NCIMB 1079 TaxID=3142847 RepID=UPI00339C11D6